MAAIFCATLSVTFYPDFVSFSLSYGVEKPERKLLTPVFNHQK